VAFVLHPAGGIRHDISKATLFTATVISFLARVAFLSTVSACCWFFSALFTLSVDNLQFLCRSVLF